MQVALISDIHGNAVALRTVLTEIEEDEPDRIVCLGDVAATGPQPSESLDLIRELDCPVVMGNADEALLAPELIESDGETPSRFKEIDRWCAAQLSKTQVQSLRAFEPTVELRLSAERQLLCYHGSPRSYSEGIEATTPEGELDEWFAGTNAYVLAGGHTHVQLVRRYRDAIVLNPGSVGLPHERERTTDAVYNPLRAEYAFLTDEDGSLNVKLRRTSLDSEAVVGAAQESDMPHADWWAEDWRVAP